MIGTSNGGMVDNRIMYYDVIGSCKFQGLANHGAAAPGPQLRQPNFFLTITCSSKGPGECTKIRISRLKN